MNFLLLNGPNLNLLGSREPEVYGHETLGEIEARLAELAAANGDELRAVQANGEGQLIDALHDANGWADGALFNPGGYTHTSVALRDAVVAVSFPVVEIHLSNPAAREEFRHRSLIAGACVGSVVGFGSVGYEAAYTALRSRLAGAS